MPLSPFISTFRSDLIAAENPAKASAADAAAAFSKAVALFFQNATLTGIPMAGSAMMPSALGALTSLITTSFQAKDAASSAGLMEAAFMAYLNAGVATWWPGLVSAVASVQSLASILTASLAAPDPSNDSAKGKLANGIFQWLTTGPQVTLNPTGTAFFK
jgi:hypothetical protein